MANEIDDPFAGTDDAEIAVPAGQFSAAGDDQARVGSTSVRARGGGPMAAWRSASRLRRAQWLSAVAIALLVLLVLPTVFSVTGTMQRARAKAMETEAVPLVQIDDDVMAARATVDPLLGCVATTTTYVAGDVSEQMRARLDEATESVYENDLALTQSKVDAAKSYFVEQYAVKLADSVEPALDEWYEADWSTIQAAEDAEAKVRSHLSADQIDQLCADVRDLGAALSAVRDEHMEYSRSYAPVEEYNAPPTTAAPTPTAAPQPTQAPEPEPEPEQPAEPEVPAEPEQPEQPVEPEAPPTAPATQGGISGGGN